MDDKIDEIVHEFSSTERVGQIRCVCLRKTSRLRLDLNVGHFFGLLHQVVVES